MINALIRIPDDWPDFLRYFASMIGIFLLGTNVAFMVEAGSLFPRDSLKFWRLFFAGKSVLTIFGIVVLSDQEDQPLTWRLPIVTIGYALSLYALHEIWKKRPYKFLVIRPDLLTDEETDAIVKRLHQSRKA